MSYHDHPRNIEHMLGAFVGPVLDNVDAAHMKAAHKELLELDGITFPDGDLKRYIEQWNANAATLRGEQYLADDGSLVDMNGFDPDSGIMATPEARLAMGNEEKLRSLVDLSILAKAGEVARGFAIRAVRDGRDDMVVADIEELNESYKQYVQLAMATERWAAPWQRFVAESFGQTGLDFPLDEAGVRYALELMRDPGYQGLERDHFRNIALIRINVMNVLDMRIHEKYEGSGATTEMIGAVALVGMHYAHSPEGSYSIIEQAIDDGRIVGTIAWRDELEKALDTVPNWQS